MTAPGAAAQQPIVAKLLPWQAVIVALIGAVGGIITTIVDRQLSPRVTPQGAAHVADSTYARNFESTFRIVERNGVALLEFNPVRFQSS